jgi:hypothetical protein
VILDPAKCVAAVEAEIEMLAAAAAKTAWSSHRDRYYDDLSSEVREILEECVVRGIYIGMTWGSL